MAARRLAMNVIQQCMGRLEPSIKQLLLSLMAGDSKLVNNQIEYHGIIYDLYCCAPQILFGVLPYVTGELLVIGVLLTFSNTMYLYCYNLMATLFLLIYLCFVEILSFEMYKVLISVILAYLSLLIFLILVNYNFCSYLMSDFLLVCKFVDRPVGNPFESNEPGWRYDFYSRNFHS